MAADPRVGERVYSEIKQAVVSGELRLRQHLDIDALARRFDASATPIRQALAVLKAERLVRAQGARGYQVAFWSEKELGTLYAWRWQLARIAAEAYAPRSIQLTAQQRRNHPQAYAAMMRHLESEAHDELQRAARSADERLAAALRAEPDVLSETADDVRLVSAALAGSSRRSLQARLRAYFHRRIANAGLIRARASVTALPSNGE